MAYFVLQERNRYQAKNIFTSAMIFALHIFSWLIYKLPYNAKVGLSDFVAFLLQKVVRYRKKVVMQNLSSALPQKNEQELAVIVKAFYRHLSDRVIEGLEMVHYNEHDALESCSVENYALVKNELQKGKSVVAVLGHCGSWELACLRASLEIKNDAKQYAVYTKISYRPLNEYVKKSRGKYGMQLFSMQEIAKQLRSGLGEKSVGMYLADQNHSNPKRAYWTNFLNQDTPFMTGPARFARAWNASIVYVEIKQKARFRYAIHLELLKENAQEDTPEKLTQLFVERLEKQLHENPADWLWSHRRWKHQRKAIL